MGRRKATVGINTKYDGSGVQKAKNDIKGIETDSSKMSQSMMGGFLKTTAAIGGVVIALKAVADQVQQNIAAYKVQYHEELKLEAALKATQNTLGYTKDELTAYATELSRATGIADEAIVGAQALMTTFTQVGSEVFPQAIEAAADMSAMFGQDLQQSVVQLGTALNDPIAGIGRLRRIGISFTEDQKEMIKTLVESGDLMGAQGVILEELNREFGGVARTIGESTLGEMDRFKNALVDIREQSGRRLLNTFDGLISKIAKLAEKWADAATAANTYKETMDKIEEGDTEFLTLAELETSLEEVRNKIDSIGGSGGRGNPQVTRLNDLRKEEAELVMMIAMLKRYGAMQELYGEKIGETTDALDEASEAVEEFVNCLPGREDTGWGTKHSYYDFYTTPPAGGTPGAPEYTGAGSPGTARGRGYEDLSKAEWEVEDVEASDYRSGIKAFWQDFAMPELSDVGGSISDYFSSGDIATSFASAAMEVESLAAVMDPLGTIFESMFTTLEPVLDTVLEPVLSALEIIGSVLGQMLTPVLEALYPIFEVLSTIILTNLLPVLDIITPILSIVAAVLTLLTPILKAVAVAFEVVMSPVKWLGDLFTWVADVIKTAVHNMVEWMEHPFNENKRNNWAMPGDFTSDAFSGLEDRVKEIWNADYIGEDFSYSDISGDISTDTGETTLYGGSSTVQRVPDIYNYNYFTGPIFGEQGQAEVGEIIVECIQAYVGSGGNVAWLEA